MEINEFSIIMLMCVYFYARISDSMYCIFLFFSTPLCYFYFLHIIVHLFVLFLLFAHNCANKYKIDNISASLSLNRFISLHYLAVHSRNIRFNPERFPGGIFKFQDHRGTVIIFTSGSVNILGCKNEEQILRLWKKLTSTLASLAV